MLFYERGIKMEDEYTVQVRGLNESVYCERLFYIMYAQGIFEHNADTITGKMNHSIREKTTRDNELDGENIFSLVLYAMGGTLSGKLDKVLKNGDEYIPIEDKNSKKPSAPVSFDLWGNKVISEVWANDFPQIVAQMYLLRKNGYCCKKGRIYYRGSNKMIEVKYKEGYDQLIEKGVHYCIKLLKGHQPSPLIDSDKCIRCSLNWVCLPDEVNNLSENISQVEPRRLYPGRPDAGIMYVTTIGSKIGKSGECFTVWCPDGTKNQVPIKDVEHICVFGNVQITTQAITAMVYNGGSISYFSSGGWFIATTSSPISKNINLRIEQFRRFGDPVFCITLAKKIVSAKVMNQRTLLRRNHSGRIDTILDSIKRCQKHVHNCKDIESIRGYEGNAARDYWEGYQQLIKNPEIWHMNGINRRPPKDEINAMISYGYSLLLRDFITASIEEGMDYLYGFFHAVVPGRPALALDMMEPYRPIIVDSVVLRMINEGIASKEQFSTIDAGVFMSPKVKQKLIYMYEKRMDEMITHPVFGYRLSYRRMIHLEMKLLGKYILGDIKDYSPLITR